MSVQDTISTLSAAAFPGPSLSNTAVFYTFVSTLAQERKMIT